MRILTKQAPSEIGSRDLGHGDLFPSSSVGSRDGGRGDSETSLALVGSSVVTACKDSSDALAAFQAALESKASIARLRELASDPFSPVDALEFFATRGLSPLI